MGQLDCIFMHKMMIMRGAQLSDSTTSRSSQAGSA